MSLDIREFKNEVKGKFFKAVFIKKNGEVREINARLGVKKYLKGGSLTYDAEAVNHLIVFDIDKKAYRTINLDALILLKYNGKEIVGNKALLYMLS